MTRTRLYDMRFSRLPSVIGSCVGDIASIANMVNSAQRRLLYAREAGDEGWWGTFAEIVFNVSREQPYITLPREIARLELVTNCDTPVPVQNQFYEYLDFGNGRMPKQFRQRGRCDIQTAYTRNNATLFTDLTNPPQSLAIYASDPADTDGTHRVLIQGLDNNGNVVYSQDSLNQVNGVFVTLQAPFVTAPMPFNQITGIQKDVTSGPIQIFQVDPTTGVQVLLLTMEPGEETSSYRRYYFNALPCGCCPPPGVPPGPTCATVQVSAIAKLDLIPVRVDTDYLLIRNMEAIIEEAQSVRYSEIDTPAAKQMAQEKHIQAIRLLNGELSHFLGVDDVAIDFRPFGSARLQRQRIGSML